MSSAPQIPATTISQLPKAAAISGADKIAIVQNGVTVQSTVGAIASGASVASINGLTGSLNIVGGSNVTVSSAGNTITINAIGIPGGSNLQVQYNNAGVLGGYTNAQLTTLINPFSNTLSGAAPASGGGTSNFLRADGSWAVPSGSGGNVSSSITSTNNEVAVYSGTGGTTLTNSFFVLAGPATSAKTYTFPNSSCTVLTSANVVTGAQGGTGIVNTGLTITLGGNISTAGALTTAGAFITSGANSLTLTTTGPTNVTLPTSGTLINTTASNIAFTGGTITGITLNNSVIGGVTPAAGTFTTLSAQSLNVTGSSAPANGIYLSAANTTTIAANSLVSAEFLSVGSAPSGVDFLTFTNVAVSGQSSITAPSALTAALAGAGSGNLSSGNYKYKVTGVSATGETTLGTASNTINVTAPLTNGQMALTAIPTGASYTARNIYRVKAGGSAYFFLHQIADNVTTTYTDNIADNSLGWSAPTSQGQIPVYVTMTPASNGSDTTMGINYKAIGTTTTGFQYNGITGIGPSLGDTNTTGTHDFYCNGILAARITDNYWNPDQAYGGTPTCYVVLSSGVDTSGSGETSCVVSAEIVQGGAPTSATLRLNSKGVASQVHVVTNGYVNASFPGGTNPNGNNNFVNSYQFNIAGCAQGTGVTPSISLQSSNGSFPDSPNFLFYTANSGDILYASDNTSSALFRMYRTASAVNQPYVKAAATGGIALFGVGGSNLFTTSDVNATLGLTANGIGNVIVYNASGTNRIAEFQGGVSCVNYVNFSAGATGVNPAVSAQGTDAAVGLNLYTQGTGNVSILTNNGNNVVLVCTNSKDTVPLGVGASAIATNAVGGFLYMTACAGTPTGIPTNQSAGNIPTVFDTTHGLPWYYSNPGGGWVSGSSSIVKTGSGALGTITLGALWTTYFITTGGGAGSVTIPASANLGRKITFVDVDGNAGANNFTLSVAGGGTINGGPNAALFTNNQTLTVQENATQWSLIQ